MGAVVPAPIALAANLGAQLVLAQNVQVLIVLVPIVQGPIVLVVSVVAVKKLSWGLSPHFFYPEITKYQKNKLLYSAQQVLIAQQELTSAIGKNILHYILENEKHHVQFEHYPKGDRIDKKTGAQYFYHCHRENYDLAEHGHFHCFLRYHTIPTYLKPAPLSDWDKYIANPMTHLIAIAMDRYGRPIRLFTVNRWVSSEIWYEAPKMRTLLKRFKITTKDSYWKALDQWITSILHLFSPQIYWLYEQRDKIIQAYIEKNPTMNVYDDKHLEEISEIKIDLSKQIQWLMK